MGKTCLVCEKRAYSDYCFTHKRKTTQPKNKVKIRTEAPKTKAKRLSTKRKWLKKNPPDQYGYWECYLQISEKCLRRVNIQTLAIEHVEPKVKAPEKKYDVNNLRPACSWCNKLKGSRTLEQLVELGYVNLKVYL